MASSQLHNALSMVLLSSPGTVSLSRNVRRGGSALSTLRDREKARTGLSGIKNELFVSDSVFSKTKVGTQPCKVV